MLCWSLLLGLFEFQETGGSSELEPPVSCPFSEENEAVGVVKQIKLGIGWIT